MAQQQTPAGATKTHSSITLYHSPGACSMAAGISLFEAGLDFEVKIVNLKNNEQTLPDFAALNPKKKVPFLVVDSAGLSENVAIQSWIAESWPDTQLLPSDPWNKHRALSYMGWFGSGIHPHITRHFKPTTNGCTHARASKRRSLYAEIKALHR